MANLDLKKYHNVSLSRSHTLICIV